VPHPVGIKPPRCQEKCLHSLRTLQSPALGEKSQTSQAVEEGYHWFRSIQCTKDHFGVGFAAIQESLAQFTDDAVQSEKVLCCFSS
jgi:hypothetical protein